MLDRLPFEILGNVLGQLTNTKDHEHLYMVCKALRDFITFFFTDVVICLNRKSDSLIFLRRMRGLHNVVIYRTYDSILDMTPLYKAKSLKHIYVNNPINVVNVPRSATFMYGDDVLLLTELKDPDTDDDKDDHYAFHDWEEPLLHYFQSRYLAKKYTKVRIKNATQHMKSKFL